MAKRKPKIPAPRPRRGFSPAVKTFITAMIANPNAARAYRLAYPGNQKPESIHVAASRLFRVAKVREAIEQGRAKKLKALEMDGDEALRRMALIARVDVRQLYTDKGQLRPIQDWPEELALAVKAVEPGQYGTKVRFDSRLSALELVARANGKLSNKLELSADDDLATLLARHARPEERG